MENINNSSSETDNICMIKFNDGSYGTGFFCKILEMNVLLTCLNVFKEKNVKEINYYIESEGDKKLTIKDQTWSNEDLDFFCVKLDNNVKNPYNVDKVELNKGDPVSSYGYTYYQKKDKNKCCHYDGKIKEIKEKENSFSYNSKTGANSFGGPIFDSKNRVIGILKGSEKKNQEDYLHIGVHINSILKDIKKQKDEKNKQSKNPENSENVLILPTLQVKTDEMIHEDSDIIETEKPLKKEKKKQFIIIIILVLTLVVFCSVFFIVYFLMKSNKKEEKKETNIKEKLILEEKHSENNYTNISEYIIDESCQYRICVYGANAEKGGKGCVQCAESYFEKGSIIQYRLGGKTSGGEGGKECGTTKKDAHNGAGLSWANYSNYFLIVAGGGGGNSESGNKGGDCERNGEGIYGGNGATKYEFGKGGNDNTPKGDGAKFKGGKGARYSITGQYCGGGGGDGYYGGGGGDWGAKGKDGGGGGGSNYCQNNNGILCEESLLNQYDYSSLKIYKKIYED